MGVIGLRSFLQAHPEFAQRIRLAPDTDPATNPVIVIDGSSLAFYLLRKARMNLMFPDYTLYLTTLGFFADGAGFKLVVFVDGNPPNAKIETVVERREKIIAVCSAVYENFGNDLSTTLRNLNTTFLPLLSILSLQDVLHELQVEVHYSVHEADHDIAIYAKNNKCFAILSQDTDFLIFDAARYIPLDTVNFDAPGRISAECYSADRTAELLHFNKKYLPLFAALVGNDYTSQYCAFFHRRLGVVPKGNNSKISDIIRTVAQFLERYTGSFTYLQGGLLKNMEQKEQREVTAVLAAAEAAYVLHPPVISERIHASILSAYTKGRMHYAALGIQALAEFKCPVLLEDPRYSTFSLNNAFSELRLRLYAALLPPAAARRRKGKQEKETSSPAVSANDPRMVIEYLQSERRYKTRKVTAPDSKFLAIDLFAASATPELRLSTLYSLFDSDCASVRALPSNIAAVALVARYILLHTTHQMLRLTQAEWHVLIASMLALRLAVSLPASAEDEFEQPPDRRSVHVANLAQIAWWYLSLANDVCGRPLNVGNAPNAFNGPLWLYCWRKSSESLASLCLDNEALLAAFKQVTAAAAADLPPYEWRETSSGRPAKGDREKEKEQRTVPAAAKPLPGGNKFALLENADE